MDQDLITEMGPCPGDRDAWQPEPLELPLVQVDIDPSPGSAPTISPSIIEIDLA